MEQVKRSDGNSSGERTAGLVSPDGIRRQSVTAAFLECSSYLKRFLAGFLRVRQDIDEVAQEAYLPQCIAAARAMNAEPSAMSRAIALRRPRMWIRSMLVLDRLIYARPDAPALLR